MKNILPILLLVLQSTCMYAGVFVIQPQDSSVVFSLVSQAFFFEDKEHTVTIDSLINNPEKYENRFTPLIEKGKNPNLDFTASSFWVKFSIKNTTPSERSFLLETARPLTNIVNLYALYPNQIVITEEHGDIRPFHARTVKHRKLLFRIHLLPEQEISYYMYLRSDGEVITLPLNLWTMGGISERDYSEQFVLGLYYGILLFVLIIFFFFYLILRDKSYLFYVGLIGSIFLLQLSLDGFSFQFLWPNSPWMASHTLIFTSSLSLLFLMLYTRAFMKVNEHSKRLNNVYLFFIGAACMGFFLGFIDGKIYALAHPYINIMSLFGLFYIFFAIFRIRAKGMHVCPYFISAFFFALFGISLFILGQLSIIPHSLYTEHGLKIGSGLEVIFLSVSMANKYREMQKAKEDAQAESLKKLEEMNRLKDELNIELEQKVIERTAELRKQKELIEEKQKEILDSIRYAKRIQDAILPRMKTIEKNIRKLKK